MKLPSLDKIETNEVEKNKPVGLPSLGVFTQANEALSKQAEPSTVTDMPIVGLPEIEEEVKSNAFDTDDFEYDDSEDFTIEEIEEPEEEDFQTMGSIIPKADDFEFSHDDDNDNGSIIPIDNSEIPSFEEFSEDSSKGTINEAKLKEFLDNIKNKFKRNKKSGPSHKKGGVVKKVIAIIVIVVALTFALIFAYNALLGKSTSHIDNENIILNINGYSQGESNQIVLEVENESEIETTFQITGVAKSGVFKKSTIACVSDVLSMKLDEVGSVTLTCETDVNFDKVKLELTAHEL